MEYPDLEKMSSKYILIKGQVQSGKTNFIINATSMFISKGFSIIHLLRDRLSDRKQLHTRLLQHKIRTKIILKKTEIDLTIPHIYLLLSNKKTMCSIWSTIKESTIPYILFIDEVDYVDSCQTTKKHDIIQEIKQHANRVFGISATIMDPIGKEELSSEHIILLHPHSNYKGIEFIQMIEIDPTSTYTGKIHSDLFEQDTGLIPFINEFVERKTDTFPHICLINICRTKDPCLKAQSTLSETYPNLSTIVYNSNGITFCQGKVIKKIKMTISVFLQYLKDNGGVDKYPHILIFAGDLAGRCISFVSEDYQWHLTEQRLLVSSTCDEPELIQKIRLCGIYNDHIPLRLYTTKKIIDDLRKAFLKQEEIITYLQQNNATCIRTSIESMEMNKKKFTSRSMVKDKNAEFHMIKVDKEVGWDYEKKVSEVGREVGREVSREKKYENLFATHSENPIESNLKRESDVLVKTITKIMTGKSTKMSTFLAQLSPYFSYKKTDLYNILKESGYQSPSSILSSYLVKKEKGYGFNDTLFLIKDDIYKIREDLAICWRS
jgi:hypothetical protein